MMNIEDECPFLVMDPDPVRRTRLAIDDIHAGRMVIMVDDEDRENEGDLVIAAECVTPEAINFMATHARGLICLTLTESQVDRLGLPMMTGQNRSLYGTGFTVSIEARRGVTTGISAFDRAQTVRVAIDPATTMADLVVPGHVFPLRARDGGVLVRTGQTEGSVDIARLAGLRPAGVICEVMNEDGTMARMPDLERFGARHRIRIVTVADIIQWRLRNETSVERCLDTRMPMVGGGEFQVRVYRSVVDDALHMALWKGELTGSPAPLVRIHGHCAPGDALGSLSCDCGAQLESALEAISNEDRGVLVYMHLHGRGSDDILRQLKGHLLATPVDTGEPELHDESQLRSFGAGAQILRDLGVQRLRLLTNNPRKIVGLEAYGLRVVERVPIVVAPSSLNRSFLSLRHRHHGHLIDEPAACDE